MPGAKLARLVVELHLGIERARDGIERGRDAHHLAAEALARKRVDLDVGALAHGDAAGVFLVDRDEDAQAIDAHHSDDRAAAGRADERAGIETALRDDAVERRFDASLAEAHRERPDLSFGSCLNCFGRCQRRGRLLQLLAG